MGCIHPITSSCTLCRWFHIAPQARQPHDASAFMKQQRKSSFIDLEIVGGFFLARLKRALTFFLVSVGQTLQKSENWQSKKPLYLFQHYSTFTSPKFNSSPLRNGSWKTILSYWEGNLSTFITPQNCWRDPLAGLLESAPASPSLPPVGSPKGLEDVNLKSCSVACSEIDLFLYLDNKEVVGHILDGRKYFFWICWNDQGWKSFHQLGFSPPFC